MPKPAGRSYRDAVENLIVLERLMVDTFAVFVSYLPGPGPADSGRTYRPVAENENAGEVRLYGGYGSAHPMEGEWVVARVSPEREVTQTIVARHGRTQCHSLARVSGLRPATLRPIEITRCVVRIGRWRVAALHTVARGSGELDGGWWYKCR